MIRIRPIIEIVCNSPSRTRAEGLFSIERLGKERTTEEGSAAVRAAVSLKAGFIPGPCDEGQETATALAVLFVFVVINSKFFSKIDSLLYGAKKLPRYINNTVLFVKHNFS